MPLYTHIRELVDKYTFVKRTEFVKTIFYIYYDVNGRERFKKLPYRTNKDQLVRIIENIKKEIDLETDKNKLKLKVNEALENDRKKTNAFGYSA